MTSELYKVQQETDSIAGGYLNTNKFPVLPSLPHKHTNQYMLQNSTPRRNFRWAGIRLALTFSTSKQRYLSPILITMNVNWTLILEPNGH